jgi:hypothetical protein
MGAAKTNGVFNLGSVKMEAKKDTIVAEEKMPREM